MTSVLKVSTIQNPSGTDAISIDSSGNVTQSQKVHFLVHKSNGDVGTNNDIVFNNVTENIGSDYSTSTGVFTAPLDGLYFFGANITFTEASGTKSAGFYESDNTAYNVFGKNGMASGNNEAQQIGLTMVKLLSANDTVKVRVTAGTAEGDNNSCSFTGFRIG